MKDYNSHNKLTIIKEDPPAPVIPLISNEEKALLKLVAKCWAKKIIHGKKKQG